MLANVNVVTNSGLKNLSDITSSDMIKCINTNDMSITYVSDIVPVEKTTISLWIRLVFSNGKTLDCSKNHTFMLESGQYVTAHNLIGERMFLVPPNNIEPTEEFTTRDSLVVDSIHYIVPQPSWALTTPYSNFVVKVGDYEIVAYIR